MAYSQMILLNADQWKVVFGSLMGFEDEEAQLDVYKANLSTDENYKKRVELIKKAHEDAVSKAWSRWSYCRDSKIPASTCYDLAKEACMDAYKTDFMIIQRRHPIAILDKALNEVKSKEELGHIPVANDPSLKKTEKATKKKGRPKKSSK